MGEAGDRDATAIYQGTAGEERRELREREAMQAERGAARGNGATGKVVGKVLTPEEQQRLAEEANSKLAA